MTKKEIDLISSRGQAVYNQTYTDEYGNTYIGLRNGRIVRNIGQSQTTATTGTTVVGASTTNENITYIGTGGTCCYINVTKSALQALKSSSTLSAGTHYQVTNATTSGNWQVVLFAESTNQISVQGQGIYQNLLYTEVWYELATDTLYKVYDPKYNNEIEGYANISTFKWNNANWYNNKVINGSTLSVANSVIITNFYNNIIDNNSTVTLTDATVTNFINNVVENSSKIEFIGTNNTAHQTSNIQDNIVDSKSTLSFTRVNMQSKNSVLANISKNNISGNSVVELKDIDYLHSFEGNTFSSITSFKCNFSSFRNTVSPGYSSGSILNNFFVTAICEVDYVEFYEVGGNANIDFNVIIFCSFKLKGYSVGSKTRINRIFSNYIDRSNFFVGTYATTTGYNLGSFVANNCTTTTGANGEGIRIADSANSSAISYNKISDSASININNTGTTQNKIVSILGNTLSGDSVIKIDSTSYIPFVEYNTLINAKLNIKGGSYINYFRYNTLSNTTYNITAPNTANINLFERNIINQNSTITVPSNTFTISNWSTNGTTATVNTSINHGLSAGDVISVIDTFYGSSGFPGPNGTFTVVSTPTTTQFTYASTLSAQTGNGGVLAKGGAVLSSISSNTISNGNSLTITGCTGASEISNSKLYGGTTTLTGLSKLITSELSPGSTLILTTNEFTRCKIGVGKSVIPASGYTATDAYIDGLSSTFSISSLVPNVSTGILDMTGYQFVGLVKIAGTVNLKGFSNFPTSHIFKVTPDTGGTMSVYDASIGSGNLYLNSTSLGTAATYSAANNDILVVQAGITDPTKVYQLEGVRKITLTTNGTSGVATLQGETLNIPTYATSPLEIISVFLLMGG